MATSALSTLTSPLQSLAWAPLVKLSRSAVLGLFSRLTEGTLNLTDVDGTTFKYGDPVLVRSKHGRSSASGDLHDARTCAQKSSSSNSSASPRAELTIKSDTFWVRMLVGADLGFAESYMAGEVDTKDLGAIFALFIRNRSALSEMQVGLVSNVSSYIQGLLNRRYANTRAGSLSNIGAHYDISNIMYEAFLSKDMTYSCAVFPTLDADVSGPLLERNLERAALSGRPVQNGHGGTTLTGALPRAVYSSDGPGGITPPDTEAISRDAVTDELEAGQLAKLRLHISRANIGSGDKVLEIGTGWGSFAIEAVRQTGCTVDSLTLSIEQKALAEARIQKAGLQGSIRVHLMDYRDMPSSWTDTFDRVVSIEMLEAVGIEFLSGYFAAINRVLKRSGGTACFQCITMPESRFDAYIHQVDFIKKWIFPGGVLPSVTSLVEAATQGSKGGLVLDSAISIGPHYSRTLREWKTRFEANFDQTIAPALLNDHEEIRRLPPAQQKKQIEVFRKKWIYYFVYCEIGFTERVIGDHILAFTREGNVTLPVICA
ncbi:cyclopropane-fatty-acyl-phospholipid synthase [Ceraceosorus guamensis]|uniref:Cyclopropane-fatty-acyl-phospholipid synthase n=1 Tax=Ceraceosorus guamensis TaxID=1522189 RepID=A0A316VPM6_9BASI|nr:cyclopropane-fatty-acyl-phospholipid synthase [Ceraceosorus guamensis]PWN39527.1 cyclopropane-fatty-acyl-phospholipid synthase [Ceraceosorus guamensis]